MQFVEITLDPHEAVIAEAGGMMYMTQGIQMETQFGDGSQDRSGFLDKVVAAGKRVLTGESLFMTMFTCRSGQRERVAFAAPYPGKIVPIDLAQIGRHAHLPERCVSLRRQGNLHWHLVQPENRTWDCLAERGSSCKSWKEMAWHSCMPAEQSPAKSW